MYIVYLQYVVVAAAFGSLAGAALYIRSMLRGGARPNRMTWFMWTVAPFISTAAELKSGVGLAVLPVFMAGFGPFLILLFSFLDRRAYWKLGAFDYACGSLSALAIVLWVMTSMPSIAVLFAVAADFLAAIPTLIKAWGRPETESAMPFIFSTFGAAAALGIIGAWTFAAYAFPAYLICINATMLSILVVKRR